MKKNDYADYKWEERADYISDKQLDAWTVKSNHFISVVEKIETPGAKLFVGPRA